MVILGERNTERTTLCMLRKSGDDVHDREDVDEEEEDVEETVEDGRTGRTA